MFELHEKVLKELSSNIATLEQHHAEMSELSNVLEKSEQFFEEVSTMLIFMQFTLDM